MNGLLVLFIENKGENLTDTVRHGERGLWSEEFAKAKVRKGRKGVQRAPEYSGLLQFTMGKRLVLKEKVGWERKRVEREGENKRRRWRRGRNTKGREGRQAQGSTT